MFRLNTKVATRLDKASQILKVGSKVCVSKYIEKQDNARVGQVVFENLKTMGPTYIKIGQFISTRSDIFGKEFTQELKGLQDNVTPMSIEVVATLIRDVMTRFPQTFEYINPEPIAAASIGQVHCARLTNGDEVVIKFKRSGIDETIRDDFDMLLGAINLVKVFTQHRQVQEIDISLREYYALLLEEIDFAKEVRNMKQFAKQFADTSWIKVPTPYDALCSDNMIVMEYVPAVKITDVEEIERQGLRRDLISQKLLECFFTQIVQHGFVHIDPHPGNVSIIPSSGKIVFYDYGMFVELNGILKENLKQLLIALYDRDIDDACDLLVDFDIIKLEPQRKPYFKKFIASFLTYLDTLNVKEFQVSYLDRIDQSEMQFLISSKFMLLLRGISIMEGNCKCLDPNFNYRAVLDPFINDFILDVSYFEKRGTKDFQKFTSASGRIMTSEISLSMIEQDMETMKKKYTNDISKYRMALIAVAMAFLFHNEFEPLAQATGLCTILYVLYNK